MKDARRRPGLARPPARRGAALVEFAILSFALYLIVAAILTFGRALFVAQVLQQATDVFAHELARTPLPPTATLADALADPGVRSTLFNPADLDVDITEWSADADNPLSLDQYLQQEKKWPLINRLLTPVMTLDYRTDGSTHLWYPGATADPATGAYAVSVLKGTNGVLTVPVVEALGGAAGGPADPFALTANGTTVSGGLAGVRLNYAFQSASFSAVTSDKADPYVTATEAADADRSGHGLYHGTDNLGQQYKAGRVVRPYQHLIDAQAVYRREVFSN